LQQLRGLEAVSGPVSRLIRKSRRVGSVRGRRHHQSDVPSNDQPARRHKHGVVADPSQLRSKGKRMTRQRRLIWDTFVAEGDGHLTADDVVERVREQLPHVNPSTVYRTLELLVAVILIAFFIVVRATLSVEKPSTVQQFAEMIHEFTGGQADQIIGHGYERFQAFVTETGIPGVASRCAAAFDSRREISRNPLEDKVARNSPGATMPYVRTNGAVIS